MAGDRRARHHDRPGTCLFLAGQPLGEVPHDGVGGVQLPVDVRSVVGGENEARRLALETASLANPAPFHPGAMKLYREKGVWKP